MKLSKNENLFAIQVLVKVHPEGKFVVDIDKNIDINDISPNIRYRNGVMAICVCSRLCGGVCRSCSALNLPIPV